MIHSKLIRFAGPCAVILMLAGCQPVTESVTLRELSGIVRASDRFALVSDRDSRVSTIEIPSDWPIDGPTPFRGSMNVDRVEVAVDQGRLGLDLESLTVLPDGTYGVLSERLAALIAGGEVLVSYPPELSPIAGRGLEGVALSSDGRLAVLWEGGWLNPEMAARIGERAPTDGPLQPVVCLHRLETEQGVACPMGEGSFRLNLARPPEADHAFRATDLVWSRSGDELIVLLASTDSGGNVFRYKWLQQFSLEGVAIGPPTNLCAPGLIPEELHAPSRNNFEGLAWFDDEVIAMINDTNDVASIVLIDIEPWPDTDPAFACYDDTGRP